MNGFEMEWLAVQFRRGDLPVALKLPGEDRGVFVIVAQRFAFGSLMFFTKMRAARFIASQRVDAHQLCEFEKIGDTSGALERLIKIFAFTRNANFAPEFLSERGNSSERFFQSFFVSRHAAFVPKEHAELAMDRIKRAIPIYLQ